MNLFQIRNEDGLVEPNHRHPQPKGISALNVTAANVMPGPPDGRPRFLARVSRTPGQRGTGTPPGQCSRRAGLLTVGKAAASALRQTH